MGDVYAKVLKAFNSLQEFSLYVRDQEKPLEYGYAEKGEIKCRLQVSRDGIGVETSREGVDVASWHTWRDRILDLLGPPHDIGWKGHDLAVLAIVHQHRIPRSGNTYDFLRERLLRESSLYNIIQQKRMIDLDISMRGILHDDIQLIVKVSSNQSPTDLLRGDEGDPDVRLIFEFHALRLEPKSSDNLLSLVTEQEERLEEWSKTKALPTIREALT